MGIRYPFWIYCSWFWVVLVGFVGFVGGFGSFCWWFWVVLGGFGSFWVVPCFSNYVHILQFSSSAIRSKLSSA